MSVPELVCATVAQFPGLLRAKAAELRQWGIESNAQTMEACADALERVIRAQVEEVVTLEEAAQRSGYSADHLGRLVRKGKIPNVGRKHAPRVRVGDLPRRQSTPPAIAPAPAADILPTITREAIAGKITTARRHA